MTNSANKKGTPVGIWHNVRYSHEIYYAYESKFLTDIPFCVVCGCDITEQELYFIELRNSF